MSTAILGLWIFVGVLYRGEVLPPPNPRLHIEINFETSGQNRLKYWRDNEQGFCERRAVFEISEESLQQTTIWLHPDNNQNCALDPDMQLGKTTVSPIYFREGRFFMGLHLGSETLFYIWEKQ